MDQWIGSVYVQIMLYRLFDAKPLSKPILCWVIVNFNQYTRCFIREMHLKMSSAKWQRFVRGWGRRQFETPWRQWDFGGLIFPGKMIRVNCVRFNMTAADAQVAQLDIGGLWAWYDLGLNVWVGFERVHVWVLKCHSVLWPIFDSCLRMVLCNVDTWVLVSTKLGV